MKSTLTNLCALSFICLLLFVSLTSNIYANGKKVKHKLAPPQDSKTTHVMVADLAEQIEQTVIFKQTKLKLHRTSKGKSELMVLLYATPSEDYAYYYFKAGERSGNGFQIHLNFRIYPETLVIHVYDPSTDKEYTVEEFAQLEER